MSQPVFRKKGGKIEKGATGLKPTLEADPELQKYLDNELYSQLDFQTKTGNYSKYFDEFGIRRDANDLPKMSGIDRPDNSTVQLNNQAQQRIQNRITEGTNQHSQGTFSAEK